MMELLEELGCPLKVGTRKSVFPVSDHSSDVIAALQRGLRKKMLTYISIQLSKRF